MIVNTRFGSMVIRNGEAFNLTPTVSLVKVVILPEQEEDPAEEAYWRSLDNEQYSV